LSQFEVHAGQALLALAIFKRPIHNALADAGLVAPFDIIGRDADTVAFLRAIELDPVEVLGADIVAAAEAWRPPVRARRPAYSLLPKLGQLAPVSP
jgi:hypothetical protein